MIIIIINASEEEEEKKKEIEVVSYFIFNHLNVKTIFQSWKKNTERDWSLLRSKDEEVGKTVIGTW